MEATAAEDQGRGATEEATGGAKGAPRPLQLRQEEGKRREVKKKRERAIWCFFISFPFSTGPVVAHLFSVSLNARYLQTRSRQIRRRAERQRARRGEVSLLYF